MTGKSQACAKTLLLIRVGLVLVALGLSTQGGLARSEVMVGTAGPLTALRTVAPLGWRIKVRNSSDATYAAVYTINGQIERKVLPLIRLRTLVTYWRARSPLFGSPISSGPNVSRREDSTLRFGRVETTELGFAELFAKVFKFGTR
jgi:hypothetical protein